VEHGTPAIPPSYHEPILIDGDNDFTYENGVVGGAGIYLDPYVIEGWEIEADTASGIEIRSTSAWFVIRDVEVFNGRDNYYKNGIVLIDVSNATIEGCVLTNNNNGIWMVQCSEVHISDNIVTDCIDGVQVVHTGSSWISIHDNIINRSLSTGIYINGTDRIHISNNTVEDSGYRGIVVGSSYRGYICGNVIARTTGIGLQLWNMNEQIDIFFNSFLDNTAQAVDDNIAMNDWDFGYPNGGNFWSDYTGVDLYYGPNQDILGSDGIGDTPYTIGVFDRYPYMVPIFDW
jgi:parallel beta-helix repeat protein